MPWDYAVLTWLNQWVSYSDSAFFWALVLTDRLPWILVGLVLIGLWFAEGGDAALEPGEPSFERRRMVLLILLAAVLAFVAARPLAAALGRPRPLVAFPLQVRLDPAAWQGIVDALGSDGAFPSDHASFWTALSLGAWLVDRRLGLASLLGTLFFSALRVGLGYHYPSDILAGMGLGALTFALVYALRKNLAWLTNPTIQFVSSYPHWMYPLGFFILIDLTNRMAFFFGVLSTLFHIEVRH